MPFLKANSRVYLLLLFTILLFQYSIAQDKVTGYTINSAQYDFGAFYRVSGKDWVETNAAGKDFGGITEVRRTDSAVYLKKPGGDSLEINVFRNMIYYIPVQGPSMKLYPITSSSADIRVTGHTINFAIYKDNRGGLLKDSGKEWVEIDSMGMLHSSFMETKRNDSMVYLKKSDSSSVLIDNKNKIIYYKEPTGNYFELYKLSYTGNEIIQLAVTVKSVGLKTGGGFYKEKSGNWVQTDAEGYDIASFTETSKKGLAMRLRKADGLEIEINLQQGHVYRLVTGEDRNNLYEITSMSNEMRPDGSGKKRTEEVPGIPVFNNLASYRITNSWAATSLTSLDVVNDGKKDKVHMYPNGLFSGQYWIITPIPGYPGYFRLTNRFLGPDLSLDIINDGTNNKISFGKTALVSGQAWKITPVPGGLYRLTTQFQGDGKSLDVINDGKNNKLHLAKTENVSGQYWLITETQ